MKRSRATGEQREHNDHHKRQIPHPKSKSKVKIEADAEVNGGDGNKYAGHSLAKGQGAGIRVLG